MKTKGTSKSKPPTNKNDRRRGRPAGKNRVPLSLEERRARNAQYERERRNEAAEAMIQLAEAARCDPQISNAELLATVISQLQRRASNEPQHSIEDLKRINENLESQIATLASRLGDDPNIQEVLDNSDSDEPTESENETESDSENYMQRPTKYRKTSAESTVHSGSEETETESSSHSYVSSHSQGSVWSYHHLGKAAPSKVKLKSNAEKRFQLDSSMISYHQMPESTTEYQRARSDSETYSENAQSEDNFEQKTNQVELQLVPERDQNPNGNNVTNQQPELLSFADLFTDREKGLLESLGINEFLNIEPHNDANQATTSWDYDNFRTY